jgi:opacity protein-like surface antigen
MLMQRFTRLVAVAVLAASSAVSVRGEDSLLFENENRFYLAPIVGASWGTLINHEIPEPGEPREPGQTVMDGNLFTAGGAAGVALAREWGQLRLEFEGRYRDNFGISRSGEIEKYGFVNLSVQTTDNWSTMANAWRDFSITNRLGIYAGGGIGAGGYGLKPSASIANSSVPLSGSTMTAFAWQAGGGVLYALNERMSLDLGYRFYSIGPGNSTLQGNIPGQGIRSVVFNTSFDSSEMLLSLRIYEPFRNWR